MTQSLALMLRQLRLPTFEECAQHVAIEAERSGWSFVQYLHHLTEMELDSRRQNRVMRQLRASQLPPDKTLATLQRDLLPLAVQKKLPDICSRQIVDKARNVLVFGLPGRGKTHLLAAIGYELIEQGCRVLFVPAYRLVQRLLAAKDALRLEKELKKLDLFDTVIVDDIGYIQQNRDEMEVLFTFLAERYERRSVFISSNLVFSQWDRIFKDPMTTAAAIDRLVHHAVILELVGPSYRTESAKGGDSTTKEVKPDQENANKTSKQETK